MVQLLLHNGMASVTCLLFLQRHVSTDLTIFRYIRAEYFAIIFSKVFYIYIAVPEDGQSAETFRNKYYIANSVKLVWDLRAVSV